MTTPHPDTRPEAWPPLPYEVWGETCATLHLWTQIVGKIRLAQMPWINHSWHVTLYPTAAGLTTLSMPHGRRTFQIDFDFIAHSLLIQTGEGQHRSLPLQPMSVAAFYRATMAALDELGLTVAINTVPNELVDPLPLDKDEVHASYDAAAVNRFFRALAHAERVFQTFRARFVGKCSPVHFFWGSFDLAVTRFSGREAPPHPGGIPNLPDWVTREAYSHEVSSVGFWPGSAAAPTPFFYSYAYPEPPGFRDQPVSPSAATYSDDFREFILPYDAVRTAEDPDATLLRFLQSTYDAAATAGQWDPRLVWAGPERA